MYSLLFQFVVSLPIEQRKSTKTTLTNDRYIYLQSTTNKCKRYNNYFCSCGMRVSKVCHPPSPSVDLRDIFKFKQQQQITQLT